MALSLLSEEDSIPRETFLEPWLNFSDFVQVLRITSSGSDRFYFLSFKMVVVPENTEMVFDQRQHRMVPLYYIDVENSVGCSEDSDGDGDG